MMSIETAAPWSTATWTVTIAATPFAFTSSTATSAYDWMTEFVAWVPTKWGGVSVTWSWVRDTATGGALLSMTFNFVAQLVADTDAQTAMGFGNGNASTHTATAPSSGTWAPDVPIAVSAYMRQLDSGDAGGSRYGVRPGVPGLAGIRPKVDALGTPLDAARIGYVLGEGTHPRRAWIYQLHRALWRHLALGAVTRSAEGTSAYRWAFETAGEAL